jgi:hypothetical protein
MQRLTHYNASALQYTPGKQVRVLLAFHVTRLDVATQILRGNMAELSKVDPGFFGQALYFSLDALYALLEYGEEYYQRQDPPVPYALLLCAVVVGNGYPVIESPLRHERKRVNGEDVSTWVTNELGHLGKPIMPGADHHFAVVAKSDDPDAMKEPVPVPPVALPYHRLSWEAHESQNPSALWTELVVKEASQVLPIAVMVMEKQGGEEEDEESGMQQFLRI